MAILQVRDNHKKKTMPQGTWVAQSGKWPATDISSQFMSSSLTSGSALTAQSPSGILSLSAPPLHSLSLSLSQNK